MTPERKVALISRADKFIDKLLNLVYENDQSSEALLEIIEDIIYALASRLDWENARIWENLFNEVKYNSAYNYRDKIENFEQLINGLLLILRHYKVFIRDNKM